jgi:hypothetical protein
MLLRLSEKHPIPFPGPIGPVRINDVPPPLGNHLKNAGRLRDLRSQEGRWPEFGVALRKLPQWTRFPLPERLTPSAPHQFPEPVEKFIPDLETKLSPHERQRLADAEGKWPEYPKLLLELARKRAMVIPGMTLPGPRELWEAARTAQPG